MGDNQDHGVAPRGRLLVFLLVIVPLGIATKFYQGPAAEWIRSSSGGILYVIFWMLLVLVVWPRCSPWRVAVAVLLVTSVLEVMQLWHPPLLTTVRNTFVGHLLLGSTFSWWDFPHYLLGCALGVLVVCAIKRRSWIRRNSDEL